MRYHADELIEFALAVGCGLGMRATEALDFSRSLVYADMRGLGSHGLMRMPVYVKRVKAGLIQTGVEPRITRDGGALIAVDGQNGMGACMAKSVMELCMTRARETGLCMAAVRNCNHFGYSGYFTRYAAEHHMIGLAMGNAFRNVAPFGGAKPMLGTNPLSVAIPSGHGTPFLLDMATSLVAQGKIILARKEGRQIPLGWGLDRDGNDTTDPNAVLEGGSLTPFGGPKGYGIALMIETLCCCLSNAAKSTQMGSLYDFGRKQDTGFILGALYPGRIMDEATFECSAAQLFDEIKQSPTNGQSDEILIPGEIEDRKYEKAKVGGVELSEAVASELCELGEALAVRFPAPIQ